MRVPARAPLEAIDGNVATREPTALEALAATVRATPEKSSPTVSGRTTVARRRTTTTTDAVARERREDDGCDGDRADVGNRDDDGRYAETVALLRRATRALRSERERSAELEVELENSVEETRARIREREKAEAEAGRAVREVRAEMDALGRTLEEVVESRRKAREETATREKEKAALEEMLEREREAHGREIEELQAEMEIARASAENSLRVTRTRDGIEVTAELYEQSHAMEKKALKEAQRARNALVEQKKTSEALEKRLRETRSRADLAEAKCRELKSAQKRWERLELSGDAAFAQSPSPSMTPKTLRQSHRDVRAYAAQRVDVLEKDVKTTKSEATLVAAELDSKLAAESGMRGATQGALESARARIRVLEGERDVLRAQLDAAQSEVADLKMSIKLTEERAVQAEETAAREIANAMDAVDRMRSAEDALGEAAHENAVALKAKSAMKRREFSEQLRALEERIRIAEVERDVATQRFRDSNDARRAAEAELEAIRADPNSIAERVREAETRAQRAEDELENVRKAALAGRRAANETLSPRSTSVSEPKHSRSNVIEASSFRLVKPTQARRHPREVAVDLVHSLREKLEASSPSWTRKSNSRLTSTDPSFTTPTKHA
ncbi:unnamed product [Ostreococcus tauri]|uniref:Unnamed product n=1 Tax=Ostreococcus tauri TaxID=70448 RepID=A0A090MB47_OSTTA|nr:unnamed product [Ostreococcus tauri]CEF99329.1 unnamed product [Ostreococcus tauri]|eukprot:XP_003081556.2 unnamed product [Ostreococcus tauri]